MSADISVNLEFTPNPDTLKYVTSVTLLPSGAANFTSLESAKNKSPLAEKLFGFTTVKAVMLGTNFVTVTLMTQEGLAELNQQIVDTIRNFLMTGEPVLIASKENAPATTRSEIEKKIIEILDRDVRPAVAMDGGDISFEKYEDGFVYLKMQGSCSGCPSSMMTLKMGVETRLREAIPEIQEVIPV
jgi:Fe-S cluster biogenesis protein NfuA